MKQMFVDLPWPLDLQIVGKRGLFYPEIMHLVHQTTLPILPDVDWVHGRMD
jgi:hypothetical protein